MCCLQVWLEEEEGEDSELRTPVLSCMQVKHTGTRTYYFSADSHEDQKDWIRSMSEAADVTDQPTTQRCSSLSHNHVCALLRSSGNFLSSNTSVSHTLRQPLWKGWGEGVAVGCKEAHSWCVFVLQSKVVAVAT